MGTPLSLDNPRAYHDRPPDLHPSRVDDARSPAYDRSRDARLPGRLLRRTAIRERADIVVLAILRTHVHLLVRTAPRIDIPRLVQFLKGGSSYAASRLPGNILGLRWSREYSATTVSPKQLAGAIRYIEEQASH